MKKKLDSRFPAARIKKIMQSDEDVGKIAMAVPLLVSKALELFLQDLCDRTHELTLKRGAKTMSSSHLKQCVQSFNVFDFLREIVHRVPDLSASTVGPDGQPVAKRRKPADYEDDGGEESSRSKMATGHTSSGGRGRGRGRGRGCERGSRANEVDKYGDDPDMHDNTQDLHDEADESLELTENALNSKKSDVAVRNFDLNMDLDEDGNAPPGSALGPSTSATKPIPEMAPSTSAVNSIPEMTQDTYSGWSLSELGKMGVDPLKLTSTNQRTEEDEVMTRKSD